MSRRTIDDWRREVYRSPTLSDRTKVLLLFLADRMREDMRVSVPRDRMARALGKGERRITERITEAHDAGFLDTIVRGQKGLTAVYQGLFPDAIQGADRAPAESEFSGTCTSPLNDAETRPLNGTNQAFRGRTGRPPIQERTCSASPDEGDEKRSNAERAPRQVAASVTACPWHESGIGAPEACACTTSTRRRTA